MAGEHDSQAGKVIAATVIGLFFAFLAVFLRFIARWYQGMRQFAEDWLIYAALISKVGIDIGGIIRKSSVPSSRLPKLTIISTLQWPGPPYEHTHGRRAGDLRKGMIQSS